MSSTSRPPPPAVDPFNADLRAALGLAPGDRLILQPTRVVPRKGIELAIELLRRLGDPRCKLIITHPAGDEGRRGEMVEHNFALAHRHFSYAVAESRLREVSAILKNLQQVLTPGMFPDKLGYHGPIR